MANALWEAAKAGDTSEASSLLDEGAPVDWKNAVAVSTATEGTLPAHCRGHGSRYNQTSAFLSPVELLRHGLRGPASRPSTVMTIKAVARLVGCRRVGGWREAPVASRVDCGS